MKFTNFYRQFDKEKDMKNDKSVLYQVIEESYLFCKDDLIRARGYTGMLGDMCRDIVMRHISGVTESDIKAIKKIQNKADFICEKLDEIYDLFQKEYPHPIKNSY